MQIMGCREIQGISMCLFRPAAEVHPSVWCLLIVTCAMRKVQLARRMAMCFMPLLKEEGLCLLPPTSKTEIGNRSNRLHEHAKQPQ